MLLSLCMVVSLFSGLASLPTLARENGRTKLQEGNGQIEEEITQAEPEEETQEEIKARLLWQIKEEDWDPYSEDMSLDEFYALMELFQEGTLPLEEEEPVAESPAVDPDTEESNGKETDTEEPDRDETDTGESNEDEADTGESDGGEANTEESNEDETDTGESNGKETDTGESDGDEMNTEESHTEEMENEEADAGQASSATSPSFVKTISVRSVSSAVEMDGSNIDEDEPNIDEGESNSDGDEPSSDEDGSNPDGDEPGSDEDGSNPDGDKPGSDGDEPNIDEDESNTNEDEPRIDEDEPSTDEGESKIDEDKSDTNENELNTDEGESDSEESAEEITIPRTLFLFSGLEPSSEGCEGCKNSEGCEGCKDGDGCESCESCQSNEGAEDISLCFPLPYDNKGHTDDGYGPDLDPDGLGYTRPPMCWDGVKTEEEMKAVVFVPGANENETTIIGDVDQDLFLRYDGYYVRQVTVQNNEVKVLGAIWVPSENKYIYYYATQLGMEIGVSATTLADGQKFIIQYSAREHTVKYKVKMAGDEPLGDDIGEWLDKIEDVTEDKEKDWISKIFGTSRPDKTNMGEYSFTAQTPDYDTASAYYMVSFYLQEGDADPTLRLGTKEERDKWEKWEEKEVEGGENEEVSLMYTDVNNGWALGMEPVYDDGSEMSTFSVRPNLKEGPGTLTTNGTFYNSEVEEDRVIIAVLREKPEPKFEIKPIEFGLDGVGGNQYDYDRGAAAAEDYDWQADYDYAKSKIGEEPYPNRSAPFPNLGKLDDKDWHWGGYRMDMEKKADGTYSYSWLFQTNDRFKKFYLDALEVNSVGITVPFFPHYVWDNYKGQEDAGIEGTDSGITAWHTETTLPDNETKVTVEYLLVFSGEESDTAQRHYRISVEGARSNVTITGMNLMLYSSGRSEFSVYDVDGVTGATVKGSTHVASIQYYDRGAGSEKWNENKDEDEDPEPGWSGNQYRANVIVSYEEEDNKRYDDNGNVIFDKVVGPSGIDYGRDYEGEGGDPVYGGANIRFKLARGYDSPYYIYQSLRDGVIRGTDDMPQTSLAWEEDEGKVITNTDNPNPVVPYVADGTKPWMSYDKDTGEPIPVTKNGERLYDKDGKPFTDWTAIEIREVEGKQVLFPDLYKTSGNHEANEQPLSVDEVIAPLSEKSSGENSKEGSEENSNNVIKLFKDDEDKLKSQYIYEGADGWYYIRVTGQMNPKAGKDYKIALLTVKAHSVRYVVQYEPTKLPGFETAEGEKIETYYPGNMPTFGHGGNCTLFPRNSTNDDEGDRLSAQFNDNADKFFDAIEYTTVSVSSLQPKDPYDRYIFLDWVLVNEEGDPARQYVQDSNGDWVPNGEEIHFPISGTINIGDVYRHALEYEDQNFAKENVQVLRLRPNWERIENPFHYIVDLKWVDATGALGEIENFGYAVISYAPDEEGGDGPTVKVLKDAIPFQNWIAEHPTYTFWDDVNNATDGRNYDKEDTNYPSRDSPESGYEDLPEDEKSADDKILDALDAYFDKLKFMDGDTKSKSYEDVKEALLDRDKEGSAEGDDFERVGNYSFTILEDEGTIAIWMYEGTNIVAFEKRVVGLYEGEDFEFEVTLKLPEGTKPLKEVNTSGEYHSGDNYFNFYLYDVEYEEESDKKPPDPDELLQDPEGQAWEKGKLNYDDATTGRVVMKEVPEGSNKWISQYLLVLKYDENDNPIGWKRQSSRDGIWLENNQRLYVACTVLNGDKPIKYSIEEIEPEDEDYNYKLLGEDNPRKGEAKAAEPAYQLFINSKLALFPATGGAGVRTFWTSGIVFLLSGLGLAWLNRDLWKRRRCFEA